MSIDTVVSAPIILTFRYKTPYQTPGNGVTRYKSVTTFTKTLKIKIFKLEFPNPSPYEVIPEWLIYAIMIIDEMIIDHLDQIDLIHMHAWPFYTFQHQQS